jgi:sugar lactone lactonase YvrE
MSTKVLLDGLCFGEGPRWHDGHLWFSDMHAKKVLKVSPEGDVTEIVEVPNLPSGLGWLPNGDLLIVSMADQRLLRFDGTSLHLHADLSALAGFDCNDMVVDANGRAYVGNFGFNLHIGEDYKAADLICVEPDGAARIVAENMNFPNGSVITPDGKTLIVGESFAGCLTAFDIAENGNLSNRRVWADLPGDAIPDGICLDEQGGVWAASPGTSECLRVLEGGDVTHRIATDQLAIACMLGGEDGKTLFILTAAETDPEACVANPRARLEVAPAPFAGAGFP